MKKCYFLLLFPFVLMSCASVLPVNQAVEEIAWNTLYMISESDKPVIAVYNLRDISENGDVSDMIVTRLTSELANAARYEGREIIIVSRQAFNEIFLEQNYILSDLSDQTKQIEIGKFLGADLILTGDLTNTEGDIFNINTQLINIQTGEIIGGDTFDFWLTFPVEND